jgi:hypothetical protein
VQSYAAIDVSGTTASNAPGGPYNVSMIALDDSNNVYFGFTAVSGTYPLVSGSPGSYSFLESNNFGLPQGGAYAFKWSNGTATLDGTTALSEFDPTGGTYQFITAEDITTTGMLIGRMESGVYGSASSGTYACAIDEMPFTSDGGEPSALCLPYPYADVDSALALLWAEISTDAYNSGEWEPGYWNCFSRAGAAGYANSYQNINDFLYSSSSGNIIGVEQQLLENLPGTGVLDAQEAPYVMVGGTITVFNPITDFSSVTLPSNLIIDPIYFYVTIINNVGSCVGYDGSGNAAYWPGSGSNLTELAPMEAVAAMNDENQVVGSTGTNGYLWTNPGASSACPLVQSGSSQLISQLIPAPLQNEVADISPIDISGTNANDGSVRILFNAQYLQPPTLSGSSPGWAPGTFLLTLTSGTPSTIFQQVSLPSNVGSTLNSPILNANGLIAEIGNITSGTGSAMTTGTNHALSLVPVQVIVKKQGDPDPAPTMSATNGVLVQNGTTLDIRLSNIPQAQFPIPQNQIVWYSRQLEQAAPTLGDTNTNDYFTAWTALGSQCTGVECTYTPTTSGIFELKATLSYSGTSQDIFYVRQCDATNATDGKGNYPPGLKQGALDYFGVYDAPIQLAIRNSAHSALGSTNYAESVSLTVPTTAPWPFSSFTIGSTPPRNDKCNAFVFVSANAAGATVPLTHTNLLGIHTNPPLAYDWYDSTYTISGWTSLGSSAYPQPGFVISRPDARVLPGGPDAGKRWAHVGILDYDGYWIQAGSKTVNKYPSVTDPAYQPVGMRKYGN